MTHDAAKDMFCKMVDDLPDLAALPDPTHPDLVGGGSLCRHNGELWVLMDKAWQRLDDAMSAVHVVEK